MIKKLILPFMLVLLLGCSSNAQIGWTTINNAATLDNSKSQKLYFVDFYTSWCGWCKKMDSETFKDPTVAKLMNTCFIPVKFDAEGASNFVWNGTPYSGKGKVDGRATTHPFAYAVLGKKMGFPSFAIFGADKSLLTVVPGFMKADEFSEILWYFASGAYRNISWDQYDKAYPTEYKPAMEKKLGR